MVRFLRLLVFVLMAVPAMSAPLPAGRVPPPASYDIGSHALPIGVTRDVRWRAKRLDARLLDAIAPLGDGPANAATWWRDLAEDGARAKEAEALRSRGIRRIVAGNERLFFALDEPLVQEARATADQARLSFHPDIWPQPALVGRFQPPGLTMLTIARSWMVHGLESPDPAIARGEFRRMIRLGRLLLQDDVYELQMLFGLTMVRDGLEALYEMARRTGDRSEQALVALALLDAERVHAREVGRAGQLNLPGSIDPSDPDARLNIGMETMDIVEEALRTSTSRRWRLRAIILLQAAALRGDRVSAARAAALLVEAASDADPLVARQARLANAGVGAQEVAHDVLGSWASRASPPPAPDPAARAKTPR